MAPSGIAGVLASALRHPGIVPDLVRAAWAFRRRGWYRRFPFIPFPPRPYLAWRMRTAYGDPEAVPPPGELRRYLRWARRMRAEWTKRRIDA